MSKFSSFINAVHEIASDGINNGIVHLPIKDEPLKDAQITINEKAYTTFGSCSYLGLELDSRVKLGAIEAIEKFGSQFSSSTAYTKVPLYEELEANFKTLFATHAIASQTTTLAHIGAIPILVDDNDIVILDHQVHNTVQISVNLLKARGIAVDMIRHSRLDILEEKIKSYRNKYRRIWYMIDGVYSMYGDFAPIKQLEGLLNKYEQLSLYIDDAHGMSCYGEHGRGYTLSQVDQHQNMVIATSLAKGFGSGGAVLLLKDENQSELIRKCSLTLMACGPSQPATLGASLASSRIHLSSEINKLQDKLMTKIRYCNQLIKEHNLPAVSNSEGPIFFIAASLPKIATKIIQKTMQDGYYTNYGVFPAVSPRNAGVRFTITTHHKDEEIKGLIESLAKNYHQTLKEEQFSEERIFRAFKLAAPKKETMAEKVNQGNYIIEHTHHIKEQNKKDWNTHVGKLNMCHTEQLSFFEQTFSKEKNTKENQWHFDYITIYDQDKSKVLLQTFFVTTIVKDDMLSSAEKSAIIEQERANDKYHMTSSSMIMGTLLTEGEHLYIHPEIKDHKGVFQLFFKKIEKIKHKNKANAIIIRDLYEINEQLTSLFIAMGFVKAEVGNNNVATLKGISNADEYIEHLSYKSRKHVRKYILKHTEDFIIIHNKEEALQEIDTIYQLYLNVKNKSLKINTFELPIEFFSEAFCDDKWDVTLIRNRSSKALVGFMLSCIENNNYYTKVTGYDPAYQASHFIYRQGLFQSIKRAIDLNLDAVQFGMAADIEKKRLGAQQHALFAFSQIQDQFNIEYINALNKNTVNTEDIVIA